MQPRDRDLMKDLKKRFVRYKEGADYYSISQTKFMQIAREANACYKIDKVVLVNCDIFEEYLETFRIIGPW